MTTPISRLPIVLANILKPLWNHRCVNHNRKPNDLLFCFLLSLSLPGCALSQATTPATVQNGCGTGWNQYLVPDSIPILRCTFRNACDEHDICYGKCEGKMLGECEYQRCRTGGDLFGQDICVTEPRFLALTARANKRKSQCDASFYERMVSLNHGKAVCKAFAVVYRDAVKNFGGGAFRGIDQFEGPIQDKEAYEAAIREFFRNGTEQQYNEIANRADSGNLPVNLRQPIQYDPNKGLVNVGR